MPIAVRPDACTRCRFCEQHCPEFALEVLPPISAPTASTGATQEAVAKDVTTGVQAGGVRPAQAGTPAAADELPEHEDD